MSAETLVVGITGGIGSGKTAVSDRFASHGIVVVDCDVIARRVVEPGQPALAEIAAHFGGAVLRADGTLDRAALRERIFAADDARHWLNRATHPRINALVRDGLRDAASPYAVLVNPLMRDRDPRAHRILVVDAPEDVQIERTVARDNVSRTQARATLASQTPRAERLAFADDVVVNDRRLEDLQAAVDRLHERYLQLAAARS